MYSNKYVISMKLNQLKKYINWLFSLVKLEENILKYIRNLVQLKVYLCIYWNWKYVYLIQVIRK